MAISGEGLRARFPLPDPHNVPDADWHEMPLSRPARNFLEENYRAALMRGWKSSSPANCPRHVWMRTERGPWVCDNCPEWRWTL